jgi:hypothetical protein
MTTTNNFGWYYVGVLTLLLLGQQFLMNSAHKDSLAKLTKQHNEQLAKAGIAPAPSTVASASTPVAATAAAPAPAQPAVTATPTPVPAPAAAPATITPAKDTRTTEIAASAPAEASKPILASAPSDAKLPKVPVRLTYRSEPFEKSKIVMLTNTSKKKLKVNVAVTRPATGETQTFAVSVAPSTELRLAGTRGWAFSSGDHIQVAQAGYAPKTENVP